jgi:hypothetical protein
VADSVGVLVDCSDVIGPDLRLQRGSKRGTE